MACPETKPEETILTGCQDDCVKDCTNAEIAIPVPDEDDKLTSLAELDVVTEESADGKGVFDIYMRAGSAQLTEQYDKGRIKGADFAKSYVAMMELMMTQANQFVLASYTAKLDAEAKILLFPYQALAMKYDAALKEAEAKGAAAKNSLVCTQVAELRINGAKDRDLKTSQIGVQAAQKELYCRQKIGFDDKKKNDDLKIIMDSWAVQATEMNDAGTSIINLLDVNGNGTLNNTLTGKL